MSDRQAEAPAVPGVTRWRTREPVYIEAIQWTGDNAEALCAFAGMNWMIENGTGFVWVDDWHSVSPGVWVVKGITGKFFYRAADVFAAAYEPAGSPQGPEGGPGTGMALIAAERARQVAAEGYTPEHDAGHPHGDLAEAAAAYALAATADPAAREFWPWDLASFKPGDAIRSLIKAGALIAAEIDRLTAMGDDHG